MPPAGAIDNQKTMKRCLRPSRSPTHPVILQGRTTPVDASQQHALPLSETEHWVTHGTRGLGDACRDGRTLYIVLDGVMADFDTAFPVIFGLDHGSLDDDVLWQHVNGYPGQPAGGGDGCYAGG